MGQYIRRPSLTTLFGAYDTNGSGTNRLGDNSDTTWVGFGNSGGFPFGSESPGGAILSYPTFTSALIPAGRKIVAVKAGHRFKNPSNGSQFNKPPFSYLRDANSARITASKLYDIDAYSTVARDQQGPAVYKSGNQEWTASEVDAFTTEMGIPDTSPNDDTIAIESYQVIVYSEPLTAPTMSYPAAGATVDTSNVPLSAVAPAPQSEQLVRAVFQVATDSGFTQNVQLFYGPYHGNTAPGYVTALNSNPDLSPGVKYVRVKLQDVIGTETAYSASRTFTITHAALPVPSLIAPAPGSTQTTPYGIRAGRVTTAASDSRMVGVEWQFSQSNTFASGIVSWKNTANKVATGDVSYDPTPLTGVGAPAVGAYGYNVASGDPSQYLIQGTWYGRVRAVDKWGQASAWGTTETFTVSHPPLAQNISPTSSTVIDQNVTPVRWTFGDPWNGDAQTAYQIKVYNDANTLVYDSGKLGSTGSPNQSLQHFLAISSTYLYQNMRYTVTLWDKDNVSRSDVANNNFVFSTSPAISMSYPASNEVVLTGQPTFQWSPGINRPGATQKTYELRVYNTGTGNLIYSSGVVTSAGARSHTPPQVILRNLNNYRVELKIVDSDGLSSTLIRNFSAQYSPPPEPVFTVDTASMQLNGYVLIDWAGTVPDNYFTAWKIYRREEGEVEWDLIETINDTSVYQYHDWLVPSVNNYQYMVTQLADRSGFLLESPIDEDAQYHFASSDDYWFIDPDDETLNVRLYNVSGDDFTDEVETNAYHVKGRGKRVNFGDYIGTNGTLKVGIRPRTGVSTRQQRANIKAIMLGRGWVYMRDPFGNIYKIAIMGVSGGRIAGTGNEEELSDLTIPYQEVF